MSTFSSLQLVATNGGTASYFLLFIIVEACVWLSEVWKTIAVWFLNILLLIITRWVYWSPELRILVDEIGLLRAYNVKVKWKDVVILGAEELQISLEWRLTNLRNASFRLHVKNLVYKKVDRLEFMFTFNLYWRILPSPSTSTGLEHNQELKDEIKPKLTRLHATEGRIIMRPSKDAVHSRQSPKILLKVKAAEAVFIKGVDVFIISGRANKLSCWLKGRVHDHGSKKKDHLINMNCLRLKFVFPKGSPNQLSHRFHGTRIRITRSNLKDVLWSVNGFKSLFSDTSSSDVGEKPAESPKAVVSHNNEQISKVRVNIEDFVISIGTHSIPEIAAIKVSLDITSDNWVGKSRSSGSLAIQGVSVSDIHAFDPCIILGNDLITASWRWSFTSTLVHKRCLIMNAESNEILSLILRPDCLGVLANLQQDYLFFTENNGPSSLTQFGENIKHIIEEHCPRMQVSSTLEGINVCLEMDVFEQLAACTLEDIRVQCTQDAENFSCDFTVKDIEVEDRINNVLSVRKLSKEGIHKRSFHATIIQESTCERQSVSFPQLYVEIVDLNISLEEELLLKLLVFFGITEKKQLWGEDKSENTKSSSQTSSRSQSPHEKEVSFFFERLEVNSIGVIISITPNQDLPEDLLKLKEQLGVANGLPPSVENARLDFERFLRTGIYYRSFDRMVRDVKRHYLKEIGRQSAKILGSLHLLGNVTGLKDNIAEGLTELKETGDYMGFARHVKSGLTDSYYKLTDSWSAYVKPSPRKALVKPVEEEQIQVQANDGLLRGITSGLGGWIFSSQEDTTDKSQGPGVTSTKSAPSEIHPPALYSAPDEQERDVATQERDIPVDVDPHTSTFDTHTDRPVIFRATKEDQPSNVQSKRDPSQDIDFTSQRDEPNVTQPPCSHEVNHSSITLQNYVTSYVEGRDVSADVISVFEDDSQSTWASMSNFTTPTGWELMPSEVQKRLKGQEFLRRLKQSINNDEDVDEMFLCCMRLRYTDASDKLNALLTTSKVYFMKVGSPSRDNVVLEVELKRLYRTQEKSRDDKNFLEIIMRMNGMQRLCLPSPNAEDNPLVRCDTLHLAAKAANKINKARKRYSNNESCPCKVILNTVVCP